MSAITVESNNKLCIGIARLHNTDIAKQCAHFALRQKQNTAVSFSHQLFYNTTPVYVFDTIVIRPINSRPTSSTKIFAINEIANNLLVGMSSSARTYVKQIVRRPTLFHR